MLVIADACVLTYTSNHYYMYHSVCGGGELHALMCYPGHPSKITLCQLITLYRWAGEMGPLPWVSWIASRRAIQTFTPAQNIV